MESYITPNLKNFFEGSKTLFESLEIYKNREKQNQNHGGKSQIATETNYFRWNGNSPRSTIWHKGIPNSHLSEIQENIVGFQ